MNKVFLYEDFKHLEKNPPQHREVDYIFHDCENELKPVQISDEEIINDKKIITKITGLCSKHGYICFFISFE